MYLRQERKKGYKEADLREQYAISLKKLMNVATDFKLNDNDAFFEIEVKDGKLYQTMLKSVGNMKVKDSGMNISESDLGETAITLFHYAAQVKIPIKGTISLTDVQKNLAAAPLFKERMDLLTTTSKGQAFLTYRYGVTLLAALMRLGLIRETAPLQFTFEKKSGLRSYYKEIYQLWNGGKASLKSSSFSDAFIGMAGVAVVAAAATLLYRWLYPIAAELVPSKSFPRAASQLGLNLVAVAGILILIILAGVISASVPDPRKEDKNVFTVGSAALLTFFLGCAGILVLWKYQHDTYLLIDETVFIRLGESLNLDTIIATEELFWMEMGVFLAAALVIILIKCSKCKITMMLPMLLLMLICGAVIWAAILQANLVFAGAVYHILAKIAVTILGILCFIVEIFAY